MPGLCGHQTPSQTGCHGRAPREGQDRAFSKANPCLALTSTYQVIVEEERPRKLKRELPGQECFPVPLTFDDAVSRGSVHYFGAELPASSLTEAKPFTVGDNQTYSGYWNPPLEPKKAYLIYFQAMSNLKGVSSYGTLLQPVVGSGVCLDQAGGSWGLGGGSVKMGESPLLWHTLGSPPVSCLGVAAALSHPYHTLRPPECVSPFLPGCACPLADAGDGGVQHSLWHWAGL